MAVLRKVEDFSISPFLGTNLAQGRSCTWPLFVAAASFQQQPRAEVKSQSERSSITWFLHAPKDRVCNLKLIRTPFHFLLSAVE